MTIKRMTKADHPQSFGAFKPVGHVVVAMPDDARAAQAVRALREKGFEALYGFTTLKTVAIKHG